MIIKVGQYEGVYSDKLWWTQAPASYDGFGTFTIYHEDNRRAVAVRVEHESWQILRYHSGMYATEPVEHSDLNDYAEQIFGKATASLEV